MPARASQGKTVVVVGARPNFMKAAPVLAALKASGRWQAFLVHTGQHYDKGLSGQFFRELGLPRPDVNLGVGSGSHARQTGRILLRLESVLREEAPDLVVVVGDVNSTLAGALAAAKLNLPVAHVEAGLRSFDRTMPEELNRLLTDAVADFLFATEPAAVENLRREGRPEEKIFLVGNVMIDSLRRLLPRAQRSGIHARLRLAGAGRAPGPYALVTLHRPANVDRKDRLAALVDVLNQTARRLPVLFPVHPRTRKRLRGFGLEAGWKVSRGRCRLLPPLGYLDFLALLERATLVLTDSGGIQEETTVLGVPCLTLRENTERPITVSEGTNEVVGSDPGRILAAVDRILQGDTKKGRVPALWDGAAATRIVRILTERFEFS